MGDLVAGGVYVSVSFLTKMYISPDDLSWVDAISWWYGYLALPFNVIVLVSVVLDYKTDITMPIFYASRYIDYFSTLELLRSQQYRLLNLNVFHHATGPVILRVGWHDKHLLRFCIFFAGVAAAAYASSQGVGDLVDLNYLQTLSVVQWTQYVVVAVHTIRTTSRIKRSLFAAYALIFTVLIVQFLFFA